MDNILNLIMMKKEKNILKRIKIEKNLFFGFILISILLWGCKKEDPTPQEIHNSGLKGIYILNEGTWNMNNSTIAYYDFEKNKLQKDIFLDKNGRKLGDSGNDLKKYGSKLYAVVTVSEQLEVMNFETCRSIKQIPLIGKSPRFIAFHQSKAYISCNDGSILRLDTTTLTIEATTAAGANPEGICVVNQKLYVANSGGMNYPNYGNTLSVIDLQTFSEIKTIQVNTNPYGLQADKYGTLYVMSRGNYIDIPASLQTVDTETDEVIEDLNLPVSNFAIWNDYIYMYSYDFATEQSWIKVMDIPSKTIIKENFISDNSNIFTPYSITVNPINQDVYITDACGYTVNGDVYCFDKNGKKKFQIEVGMNPNSIVFVHSLSGK